MRTIYRALSLIAILVLLSPLTASAQRIAQDSDRADQGLYQNIRILVKDLGSDREIASVRPGGTITLREGQRVRLIMTADAPGRGRDIAYPETEFTETDPGRGWVRVTRTNVDNANATVKIERPRNATRNRSETLRYRIIENIGIPSSLREGTITIQVEPTAASGQAPGASTQQARNLTASLYKAILMRDMDEAGAKPHINSIVSGGYPALIQVAERIAESDESRIRVYEREGVCNQQRLLSMYKNLLGLSSSQIDRDQWTTDLRRMNEGKIDEVVLAMVRSNRFKEMHDIEERVVRY